MKAAFATLPLLLLLAGCDQKPVEPEATPVPVATPAPATPVGARGTPAKATDARAWMFDPNRSSNPFNGPTDKKGSHK